MHDNNQKKQMAQAWDTVPLGRAVKVIWVVLKYGVPAGAEGRDISMDVSLAEKLGIKDFGVILPQIAPANQYVFIPAMNGESAKFRFSKDFLAVVANSYSAHLARMAEANMRDSSVPMDTALGIILKSAKETESRHPGLNSSKLAQRIVLGGSYQLLINALKQSSEYTNDVADGAVVPGDIRVLKCAVGKAPQVKVTTPGGGQKTYALDLDDLTLKILHGEMSGIVAECPYAPSLDFPLVSASYTAMFLHERGEVLLDVQWEDESSRADDWSGKLVFR